jgi:hypothetical protein
MIAHRLVLRLAPALGVGLLLLATGCAAGVSPKAPADATPTTAASVARPAPAKVTPDLVVYTFSDFQIHGAHTKGRWFRRTGGGWEAADCSESINPDSGNNPGPDCGAWSAVPTDKVPLVESARAAGYERTTCAKQKALCDAFGLAEESR